MINKSDIWKISPVLAEIDGTAALNYLVFLKTSEGNPWMLSRFGSA